jgi:hypothetical protein
MYFLRLQLDKHHSWGLPCFTLSVLVAVTLPVLLLCQAGQADEVYGPVNWLKTLPNPFTSSLSSPHPDSADSRSFDTLSLDSPSTATPHRSLRERFNAPRLFLPERMTIGKSSEFLIKATPGYYAAIAMADKNKGAKAIFGHVLRLGPDRKVVAVGEVPPSGVLSLFVEAPIEGDLIGQPLYFEAAVWSRPNFSDLIIATPVSPQVDGTEENAVVISGENDQKKNGLFVFDQPGTRKSTPTPGGLNTGSP